MVLSLPDHPNIVALKHNLFSTTDREELYLNLGFYFSSLILSSHLNKSGFYHLGGVFFICNSMEVRRKSVQLYSLFLVCVFTSTATNALPSPKGVNSEVQALMAIKDLLEDPHGALDNWDVDSVDPCSWTMVTCSTDNTVVIGLGTPSHIYLVLSLKA